MAVKLGNGQWAVKENNLLAYNDNSGQFFNKEFDFTRGSSATYVGKDGLIKTVGLQDTNLVQNGDFSQLGSELVTNSDFSDGLNGWSAHAGSTLELENGMAKVTSSNNSGWIKRSDLSIESGKTYFCKADITNAINKTWYINGTSNIVPLTLIYGNTYGGYVTVSGNNPSFYIKGNQTNGEVSYIDNVSVKQVDPNDEWILGSGITIQDNKAFFNNSVYPQAIEQTNVATIGNRYRVKFTVSDYQSGTVKLRHPLNIDGIQANGDYVFEGEAAYTSVVIRGDGSPNNFKISDISVQEIQVNTPRIDFSDSVDGALLLEPQRTNRMPNSEDGSTWTLSNLTLSSLSGGLNKEYYQITSLGNTGRFDVVSNNWVNLTAGTYTASVFAKKGTSDQIILTTRANYSSQSAYSVFNLTSGTVVSNNGVTGSIEPYSDGWYRCAITFTNSGSYTDFASFAFGFNFNSSSTDTLFVASPQSEIGSYATSYIPTQGSTSTRIAETCNNSGSAQDFNDSEGVLYGEFSTNNTDSPNWLNISDTTAVNWLFLGKQDGDIRVYLRANNSVILDYTKPLEDKNKIALSYKSGDIKVYVNGVNVDNSTNTFSFTSALSRIDFNQYNGGGTQTQIAWKAITVFNTALTDEELIELTKI